ncbi:phage holin family protein [Gammaproteobacteria bacterium AS21]
MTIQDILLCIISLASCFRLLFYRRGSSPFKAGYSFLAYLLIVINGAIGLAILTGLLNCIYIPNTLIAIMIINAIAIFYCHGNVAHLVNIFRRTSV